MVDERAPSEATPQRQAYESSADVLFYGGAAGGGKSDLLLGLALTAHRRSIIFRRQSKQIRGFEQRMSEILGGTQGYNSQNAVWKLPGGRLMEFGHCQHVGDEMAYQGRPHDLKGFDEITHFAESQFRFLSGWLRTSRQGQRQRIVATGNPPTDNDGQWVTGYWAPWLDDTYENPALPGELRYFVSTEDGDREVEGPEPVLVDGELVTPKSRTFIPSRVEDNPYLMRTGYRAQLQSLPEPLRSQMLRGDFLAGREDDPWQVVPTGWVEAAQQRWQGREKPRGAPMDALGVDPARGGADEFVLAPRYANWFGEMIVRPGAEVPDGPSGAALVVQHRRDNCVVNLDAIGIGSSVLDHLRGNDVTVKALVGSEASHGRDKTGSLGFVNLRSEWWWRMREALDPSGGEEIALPPDPRLKGDLCALRWKLTARGIQVEPKSDAKVIERLGRSPDRGDAAVYALAYDTPDRLRRGRQATSRPMQANRKYSPVRRGR